MTPEQAKEILAILDLANENGKFAIAVGLDIGPGKQITLERGMNEDWFRLIDVTPINAAPGQLCRVFKLTPTGEMQRNMARDTLR
jgi:hypothetical protein